MKASFIISEIVALRNEKGSYNLPCVKPAFTAIVALRNEKGSYNTNSRGMNTP